MTVEAIAQNLGLGALLSDLRVNFGGYQILDHWQRGEFHHDLLLRVEPRGRLPGPVLVVATNCNGGVKEVLCLATPPDEGALWHYRCPEAPGFSGALPPVLAQARTVHWFDPCALLAPDARSEYRPEHRERQPGGGWQPKGCGVRKDGV
ncbi:MAG TPA: hypothetical protein VMT03_00665 [Polyangia bacterium]|nr:hypothetical protein [Polyangia bacterium]